MALILMIHGHLSTSCKDEHCTMHHSDFSDVTCPPYTELVWCKCTAAFEDKVNHALCSVNKVPKSHGPAGPRSHCPQTGHCWCDAYHAMDILACCIPLAGWISHTDHCAFAFVEVHCLLVCFTDGACLCHFRHDTLIICFSMFSMNADALCVCNGMITI